MFPIIPAGLQAAVEFDFELGVQTLCHGPARLGPARPGPARPGPARPGSARPGPERVYMGGKIVHLSLYI